jgi:general secretion pathway protein D
MAGRSSALSLSSASRLLMLVFLLLVSTTACEDDVVGSAQGPVAPAVVRFVAAAPTYRVGQEVRLDVRIEQATDVDSVAFNVRYDPTRVQFVPPAHEGGFLTWLGAQTTFLAEASTSGEVAIQTSRERPDTGANGAGVLATVSFRAIATGRVPFTATAASVRDPAGVNLPASFVGTTVAIER